MFRLFILLLLWLGCHSTYSSPRDQIPDKLSILGKYGGRLSPAQRRYILYRSFSSRQEIEKTVEFFVEQNHQREEVKKSTSEKEQDLGVKIQTFPFLPGRDILSSDRKGE